MSGVKTAEEPCRWLHEALESLPEVRYPFRLADLPDNGIYFLYEHGETCGHGDHDTQRPVRVGTHRDGNFRSRINDHFVLTREPHYHHGRAAPHDRSIFRKNIGRALLGKDNDSYLSVWEIDFTPRKNREHYGHLRDLEKEREVERRVTEYLRSNLSFRYILCEGQDRRMGAEGLEGALIGTLAQCSRCRPSAGWLGNASPKDSVRESGLWLAQHLRNQPITDGNRIAILEAIHETEEWIGGRR